MLIMMMMMMMMTGWRLQRQETWHHCSCLSAGGGDWSTDSRGSAHQAYLVVADYHGQLQLIVDFFLKTTLSVSFYHLNCLV